MRSKFSRAASDDLAVRSIMSEFSSAIVEGGDPRETFATACSASEMVGPEPGKLAARMGAASLIGGICRQSGLPDPGIDPAGRELMRSPEDPESERR